jgi:hypothetical protein
LLFAGAENTDREAVVMEFKRHRLQEMETVKERRWDVAIFRREEGEEVR